MTKENVIKYLSKFEPIILRVNKNTQKQLCEGFTAINFGASKGLGFKRVLIIPTEKQMKFLSGNYKVFDSDKTQKAKSSLYVAITRAKYSVSFLCEEKSEIPNVSFWQPS